MPGDIAGYLTDVGLKPLSGRFPQLFLVLSGPSTYGSTVMVTDKYQATLNNSTGYFEFKNVVGTDEMLPERTYRLRASWDALQELDVITNLHVPSGGGSISDLIAATGALRPGTIMWGFGPPHSEYEGIIYIDISGTNPLSPGNPVLYGPSNGGA